MGFNKCIFLSLFTEYQLIRCNSSSLWNAKPENPSLYISFQETIKRFWKFISELKIANKGSKIRLKCRHFELWKVWFSMYLLKLMEKKKRVRKYFTIEVSITRPLLRFRYNCYPEEIENRKSVTKHNTWHWNRAL